jgi:hypothetical protein
MRRKNKSKILADFAIIINLLKSLKFQAPNIKFQINSNDKNTKIQNRDPVAIVNKGAMIG